MNPRFRLTPLTTALALALPNLALAQQASPETSRPDTPLPTVGVKGQPTGDEPAYQAVKTGTGKLPQALRDIPQAVTVVTNKLIQDKNADTLKEALRNVSGLTYNAGEGGRIGDNMLLRGFYTFGDTYMDGIRDVAQYNRDTFNLEQVDVLRGSGSMLFGRGQAGGVINQVSKQAFLSNRSNATATTGTGGYQRASADVNHVVGQDAALRLNVMKTSGGSTRDEVKTNREGFAPTLRLGIGTADEIELSLFYLRTHNTPDYGVPFFNQRPINVPGSTFYGTTSDYEDNTTKMFTASYQHIFADDSKLKTVLRWADYTRDLLVSVPRLNSTTLIGCPATAPTSISDSSILCRSRNSRGGAENTWTSQTDYTTQFNTGTLKHDVLAGVELLHENAGRWSYSGTAAPVTLVGNPDHNPVLPSDYTSRNKTGINTYSGNTIALYAQDMVEFTRGWKVLGGIRRDQLSASYSNGANVKFGEQSYRTGLLYQPSNYASYYLGYSDSFSPTADLYQFTSSTTVYPAERSKVLELGAKWDLYEGDLSLRTTLYRADKQWERNTDVDSAQTATILTKQRRTHGLEFELAGRLSPKWEVFSGVAFMQARILEQAPGRSDAYVGMRPRNTPAYTYNLWTTYKLGDGWKIGGGIEGMGSRTGYGLSTTSGAPVVNVIPHYVRVDGLIAYEQKAYSVKLNLFNLLNRKYHASIYENGGHAVPGTGRSAQVTLGYKF